MKIQIIVFEKVPPSIKLGLDDEKSGFDCDLPLSDSAKHPEQLKVTMMAKTKIPFSA